MKVLLMLPGWDRKIQWGPFHRGAGNNNFSYGLASIAAYLEDRNISVSVIDPQFIKGGEEGIKKELKEGAYDVIGITCFTPTILNVYSTAKLVKEVLPKSHVVFGGAHATSFPRECLQECASCDYVVVGEGEEVLYELVKCLRSGQSPAGIKGLACRDGENIIVGERRPYLDVENLPMPAYHLHDPTQYKLQPTAYRHLPTITLVASRGCPYPCTFCHAFEILGRKPRFKSVNKLMHELQWLIKHYDAKGFMFQDSTFTIDRSWTIEFCEAMTKARLGVSWLCYTRADKVDRELLLHMKRAGCWGISFGVESANQKSLDLIRKQMTVEQNERSIRDAMEIGLYVTATYMLGLPGEDEEDVRRTIAFAERLATPIANFFLPVPYPRTVFYEQCLNDGGIDSNVEWSYFSVTNYNNPVYINPRIGKEKMIELRKKAMRDYYLCPRVLMRNVSMVRGLHDLRRSVRAALALSGLWL